MGEVKAGAVTTGQFLTDAYVQSLSERKLQGLIDNGVVVKSCIGKYELTAKGVSCFEKADTNTVSRVTTLDLGQTLGFEKSNLPAPDSTAPQQHTFLLKEIYERLSINNENDSSLQTELNDLLIKNGITINDGEFNYEGTVEELQNKLQSVIKSFVEGHKDKFVVPAEDTVEFDTNNTDSSVITELTNGDTPAIILQEGGKKYKINNREAVENALPKIIVVNYEDVPEGESSVVKLSGLSQAETVVTRPEGLPEGNDGTKLSNKLRENKNDRRTLETNARAAYETWANAPENQDAVTLYVAANKYGKKVEQRTKELVQGVTHAEGINADGKSYSISKEYNITGGEVFDLFLNRLPEEQRDQLLSKVMEFANSDNKTIKEKLQNVLKGTYETMDDATFNGPNGNAYKVEAAKLLFLEGLGVKPSDLLHMLAVNDVMGARTSEQVQSDKQYFIEHQSKDYVRNMQAQQDKADTTVHFSKKARKAGTDGIHTDIGNRGRALVHQAPKSFCTEATEDEFNKAQGTDQAEEYFTSTVTEQEIDDNGNLTGKTKTRTVYYKFDSQKYKDFMELACDPTKSFDPTNAPKLKDLNMTLKEGRDGLELHILDKDGHMVPIVNLLGNNNGKVDNSELNAWRHLAEKAGLSTDGNPTYMKRLGDFAKKFAINGAMFVGTAGLGNIAGGLLNIANSTLPQVIKQPDKYFTTPDKTFRTDDKYISVPGQTIKVDGQTFDHNINIDGVDYPVSFQGPDTYINIDGQTIKVEGDTINIKGETYKIKQDDVNVPGQKPSINLTKVAIATTLATGIGWFLNDRDKIHAQGRANDDLFDPTVYTSSLPVDREVSLNLPQFRRVETREGSKEVGTEPIIHKYTTIIAGVKQELLACYPEATEADYAQILNAVAEANGIEGGNATGKLWAGRYTDANGKKHNGIYVPPTITLSNGTVVKYQEDHTTATKIKAGGGGNNYDVTANSTKRTIHAKGTIR